MLLVFSEGILRQAVELVMPLCSFTMSPPFPAFPRTSQPLPGSCHGFSLHRLSATISSILQAAAGTAL